MNQTGNELDQKNLCKNSRKKNQIGEGAVKYWPYFNSF